MGDELEDGPLTDSEILTFGPCVEAQVWTTCWLQEARAPIAVAAGRPKLGRIFNDDGIGRMVTIRPCMSRGRRLRGLPPVYTPGMLEKHSGVFDGWPMFTDHVPPAVAEALAKTGRSVRELGGQVLRGHWDRDFVQENDEQFGYRKGATIAEVWATPLIRQTVGNNPGLLHTSINAWPTSGKPGPVPWRPGVKGMLIEGIRRQPQGSVDYVVRGGAGGKLLLAEGLEEEGAWPEVGEWAPEDARLVVSLAESLYASPRMADVTLPTRPDEFAAWLQENAPHLVPALGVTVNEADADEAEVAKLMKGGMSMKAAWAKVRAGKSSDGDDKMSEGLTEAQVQAMIAESQQGTPTVEEFEQRLSERAEAIVNEREEQRLLAERAAELIESAEGILPSWKKDLKARYALRPDGQTPALLCEAETTDDGKELTPMQVLERRVTNDLSRVRDLLAEAQGKPRVKGEGGARRDPAEQAGRTRGKAGSGEGGSFWRGRFVSMGLAESEDKAVEAFGGKVEG